MYFEHLTGAELRKLFLDLYPVDEDGCSDLALIEDLVKICPDFKTQNGCQWARTGTCWDGIKYKISRPKQNGKVYGVQLVGFEDKNENHSIPAKVKRDLSKRCVILDISTNIEIDHKDARYESDCKELNDFQALCKTANDAKRQHCKECKACSKRYDARQLGYSIPYIAGNEDSDTCIGCYWYDPVAFNKEVSKNYRGA